MDDHVLVTSAATSCLHCQAPIPSSRQGNDHSAQFCCHGCETVYGLLHDEGLDYYYSLRQSGGVLRPDAVNPAPGDHSSVFDDPDFCAKQVRILANGQHSCRFYVAGLHCAACVWLLEKAPSMLAGLEQSASILPQCFDVTYNPATCDLAAVARCIQRLGYQPHPEWCPRRATGAQERRHWTMRLPSPGPR